MLVPVFQLGTALPRAASYHNPGYPDVVAAGAARAKGPVALRSQSCGGWLLGGGGLRQADQLLGDLPELAALLRVGHLLGHLSGDYRVAGLPSVTAQMVLKRRRRPSSKCHSAAEVQPLSAVQVINLARASSGGSVSGVRQVTRPPAKRCRRSTRPREACLVVTLRKAAQAS